MKPAFYLLDTNTLSFLVNGRSPAVRKYYVEADKQGARIGISAITEAEALFGLARRPEATRLRANFDRFFQTIDLLPWDSAVARAYAALRSELSVTGKNLGLMDLMIASHAIASDATLVTHDRALINASPSLKVVDWATDL
jgi:tRNA(fMet)-specific endonuclease VapC